MLAWLDMVLNCLWWVACRRICDYSGKTTTRPHPFVGSACQGQHQLSMLNPLVKQGLECRLKVAISRERTLASSGAATAGPQAGVRRPAVPKKLKMGNAHVHGVGHACVKLFFALVLPGRLGL